MIKSLWLLKGRPVQYHFSARLYLVFLRHSTFSKISDEAFSGESGKFYWEAGQNKLRETNRTFRSLIFVLLNKKTLLDQRHYN